MNSGVVDDSKFDGCTVFMSSMDNSSPFVNGGTNRVEVKNSLVWLRPFHNSYNTTKYGFDRHGGFFKWAQTPATDGVAPKLSVHDSVFRSDDPAAYGGNANGFLGLPPGTSCNNVTLVNPDLAGRRAAVVDQPVHEPHARHHGHLERQGVGLGFGPPHDVARFGSGAESRLLRSGTVLPPNGTRRDRRSRDP